MNFDAAILSLILLFKTGTYKKGSLSFIPRWDLSGASSRPGRRPRRAVLASLAIYWDLVQFNEKIRRYFDLQEIRMRISRGIAAHVTPTLSAPRGRLRGGQRVQERGRPSSSTHF
jgi:hypothetical protein